MRVFTMNKKLLYTLPVTAMVAALVVVALQTGSGFPVSASVTTGNSVPGVRADKVVSDNPYVVMENWQETGIRTKGSKFVP
jgi:hypothetical protein